MEFDGDRDDNVEYLMISHDGSKVSFQNSN